MSNRLLSALIDNANAQYKSATSKSDLLAIARLFCDFKGPLEYDIKLPVAGLVTGLLMILPMCWALLHSQHYSYTSTLKLEYFFAVAITGFVLAFVCGVFMFVRGQAVPDLSSSMLFFAAKLNTDLRDHPLAHDKALNRLQNEFSDFDRGNYSREIKYAYQSVFKGSLHELKFDHFKFEWVDEKTGTRIVSDGKTSRVETYTYYETYYRYCVVVDFPWVKNLMVAMDAQKAFKFSADTALTDFNRTFDTTGTSEIECMKFLKPTTVLHLLEMAKHYGDMNLEFSANGRACLSFSNSDLLDYSPSDVSLEAPQAMYDAIEKGITFPKLQYTLKQLHLLAEQHDDNFADPKQITA